MKTILFLIIAVVLIATWPTQTIHAVTKGVSVIGTVYKVGMQTAKEVNKHWKDAPTPSK